jgi:hypothetical protein
MRSTRRQTPLVFFSQTLKYRCPAPCAASVVGGPVPTGLLLTTAAAACQSLFCDFYKKLTELSPATAAACQSFFYDFYKKLTELSANNFRLLFCWPSWSSVATLVHHDLRLGCAASVVGGGPVSTGLLQQPLASLYFTASTKSEPALFFVFFFLVPWPENQHMQNILNVREY